MQVVRGTSPTNENVSESVIVILPSNYVTFYSKSNIVIVLKDTSAAWKVDVEEMCDVCKKSEIDLFVLLMIASMKVTFVRLHYSDK